MNQDELIKELKELQSRCIPGEVAFYQDASAWELILETLIKLLETDRELWNA